MNWKESHVKLYPVFYLQLNRVHIELSNKLRIPLAFYVHLMYKTIRRTYSGAS